MKYILNHTILPEAEIHSLILAYRGGDKHAAEKIIEHNERAIYRIAKRYFVTGVCGDVPLEDLMQMGRMGLLRALEDYDLDSGNKFMTYAWQWIRQSISRYGKHEGQQIGMSYKAAEHRGNLCVLRAKFVQENNREPSQSELETLSGYKRSYMTALHINVKSMDYQVNKTTSFGETIADHENDPAALSETRLIMHEVKKRMKKLPVRSQNVLKMAFGLDGTPPVSLRNIAKKYNVSVERISQIKDAALAELRNNQ